MGVALARKAFDPKTGPLRDVSVIDAEREATAHFFAGAMGSFKNPHSHRYVAITDPAEAVELLFVASHLLRIVGHKADRPVELRRAGRPRSGRTEPRLSHKCEATRAGPARRLAVAGRGDKRTKEGVVTVQLTSLRPVHE